MELRRQSEIAREHISDPSGVAFACMDVGRKGRAIYKPGVPIDDIYFPQSGMISLLVVAKDGGAIETATIGRDGVAVGLHAALGKRLSFTRAATQVASNSGRVRSTSLLTSLGGSSSPRSRCPSACRETIRRVFGFFLCHHNVLLCAVSRTPRRMFPK